MRISRVGDILSDFNKDYDIDFLTDVIKYNHERYMSYKYNLPFEENLEYEKVLNARRGKCCRIRRHLIYLLTRFDYIWFCTFTFSNDYINKCTRTKRDLIKSVLNTHDFKYILNIDYGKTTEREHYHCIIGTNWDIDVNQFIQNNYPCHSLSILCKKGQGDYVRLSKYINKLTNHCIKATTKRQRIVYNFKGYDGFCDNRKTATFLFHLDSDLLFSSSENDTLLDKGVITGKI